MTEQIMVRTEEPGDCASVESLIKAAFADVRLSDHQEHNLVKRLRLSTAFIPELSLVAVASDQGIVLGHILLTRAQLLRGETSQPLALLALAPLSVHPDFQLRGIGSQLINAAHEKARRLGFGAIIVVGHADYYPRFGYRQAKDYGISFPFHVADECGMVVELKPGALCNYSGCVRYDPAFGL